MIEINNLKKIYKPKKGVPVTALNGISLKFPETGMVFLLGKSGSGKSTLLNLLGGLDKYDDGDIIIKGVSTKDFNQQRFDSYRNTYVGFIFQEYNILEEFSVGANIALALELQGQKATDEEINAILKEVDLEGYGSRKPNELSGGQKQRVAIARALVKKPKIIMADEPTGALDSNTGRQVFDTLKKLSKDKLVIIVSHDREFSELYADRIIELSDGNVISDDTLDTEASSAGANTPTPNLCYDGDTITVKSGYHLTEEDRIAINKYLDECNQKINIRPSLAKSIGKVFKPTNTDNYTQYDGSDFKLIKSKLPMKNAFKIGAGALKHKKIRLIITIFLSCIAFGLFGLSDTFGSYDFISAGTKSLMDSQVDYISLVKAVKHKYGNTEVYEANSYAFSDEEIQQIEKQLNQNCTGVFSPKNTRYSFESQIDSSIELSKTHYDLYRPTIMGYTYLSQKDIDDFNYKLVAGKLPDEKKNEVAISKYIYTIFNKCGYREYESTKIDSAGKPVYEKIEKYEDLIGKTINYNETTYTITGIIDTNFHDDRYISLTEERDYTTTAQTIADFILYSELNYDISASLTCVLFVGDEKLESIIANEPKIYSFPDANISYEYEDNNNGVYLWAEYHSTLSNIDPKLITWVDDVKKTSLKDNEIIVSSDLLMNFTYMTPELLRKAEFTQSYWDYTNNDFSNTDGIKIVGVIDVNELSEKYAQLIVVSDSVFNAHTKYSNGNYAYVVSKMPKGEANVRALMKYSYRIDESYRYELQNAVMYELNTINMILKELSQVFFYIGIFFAIFASIMLANFIGSSIAYKKQEIGILRAIGSRSNDVFRIFFSEAFVIAMINFILSSAGVLAVTTIVNSVLRTRLGILISILTFGIRQIILLFVISIAVAFLASFFPVMRIASKKPIDAIRNR